MRRQLDIVRTDTRECLKSSNNCANGEACHIKKICSQGQGAPAPANLNAANGGDLARNNLVEGMNTISEFQL